MSTHTEVQRITARREEVRTIDQQSRNHLRESSACDSMKDHLEHWNWRMHRSYVVSELCRPMLAKRDRNDEAVRRLRSTCVEALADTVDAFLHLHNLTVFAHTSWAAVHRSLSSALLLGILKEPARNERVRLLLDKIVAAMSGMEFLDPSEVPSPVSRAIAALVQLNDRNDAEMKAEQSSSVSSSTDEPSPHAQMQSILWGSPPTSHLFN